MIFNPWFWLFLVATWIASAIGGYFYSQKGIQEERATAKVALEAANKHAEEVTNERNITIANISSDLAAQTEKADKAAKDLRDHLASSALQLRVHGSCNSNVSGNSTFTSADNAGICNIDPRTSEALVAITERGDRAIEKLNACIASYEALMENHEK